VATRLDYATGFRRPLRPAPFSARSTPAVRHSIMALWRAFRGRRSSCVNGSRLAQRFHPYPRCIACSAAAPWLEASVTGSMGVIHDCTATLLVFDRQGQAGCRLLPAGGYWSNAVAPAGRRFWRQGQGQLPPMHCLAAFTFGAAGLARAAPHPACSVAQLRKAIRPLAAVFIGLIQARGAATQPGFSAGSTPRSGAVPIPGWARSGCAVPREASGALRLQPVTLDRERP